ncbi:MAG: DUF4337 family protein [Chitinophagaceae bacterium]
MDEIEVPTEHLHEQIHEKVQEEMRGEGSAWSLMVALSTAIMAVLAAITALMAGHQSDEALIEQIRASDQWAYYQSKGIKAEIAQLHLNQLVALGKQQEAGTIKMLQKYKSDQVKIKKVAQKDELSSAIHLNIHQILARGVTLFQIAIAISAISILIRRKNLWMISLVIALVGLFFMVQGIFFT